MKVSGKHYRTIWMAKDGWSMEIIDQTKLPFAFETLPIKSCADAARAIKLMQVRGAPLIGATAAYGMCLAMREDASDTKLKAAYSELLATRPTAINLKWALERMKTALLSVPQNARVETAYKEASALCEEDVNINRAIGEYGLELLRTIAAKKGRVNVLTHCNAGWLGTVDYGTAIAPIYLAHDEGMDVHVWVEETRPRNQGGLTAWELKSHGIKHTYIVDNSGGHVMQHGLVDIVIVGTDRTTRNGDVCNKIGTYLKALSARDNNVPFYAAVPTPSIDWSISDGVKEIPIEERDEREVTFIGETRVVQEGTKVANFGFDVTPARLVTGYITEKGIFKSGEISKILNEQESAHGNAISGKR